MNDENEEIEEFDQDNNGSNMGQKVGNQIEKQVGKEVGKTAKKEFAKKVTEESAKVAAKIAAKGSLLAAIGPILIIALIVIFIIIVIIGIVLFLKTMPGMVTEKLKDLGKELVNNAKSWWGEDSITQVDKKKEFEVLEYLEEMGYDLKGYGFLTKYFGDEDDAVDDGVKKDKNGDGEEVIVEAESKYVYTYLMSDNYVYTIQQENLTTTGWFKHMKALFGHIFDGLTESWSRGLIKFYYDDGVIGDERWADYNDWFNTDDIEIKPESQELIINKGSKKNTVKYKLDGWTGRYGMPLEFLLSVHLATMMPDLAFDMVDSFVLDRGNTDEDNPKSTVIHICLHPIGGKVTAGYKVGNGYLTSDDFENSELLEILQNFGLSSSECEEDCASKDLSDEESKICGKCKSYLKSIKSAIDSATIKKLDIYQPYISRVTGHWYRDVYYVTKDTNKQFVTYDYDYEALMKERWTLYETYGTDNPDKMGEFVLYKIKEDGSYGDIYNGTLAEANADHITVAKKPITEGISTLGDDLNWNKIGDAWSAYDDSETNTSTESWEQLYPDSDDEIQKNIYACLTTTGNLVQTGEGLRTETNNRIKKMFLNNRYFRYTGNPKDAEAITKLREEKNIDYGPLNDYDEDELKNLKISITVNGTDTEYNAYDLSGKVQINQDSLNAFSMLENTHTLDADYIYRDFKELIVELGYFEKEELTDETPRLLEFPVPEIGSAGYPNRAIDKKENEFDTMIHSKGDIDANEGNTLAHMIEQLGSEIPEDINDQQAARVKQSMNGFLNMGNNIINPEVGAIGGSSDGSKDPTQVSIDEFLETTREMCEYINKEGYDYCVLVGDAGNGEQQCHHAPVHGNPCSLPTTFAASQESVTKHNFCCATLVSWALQNVGVMPDSAHLDGADSLADWISKNLDPEVINVGDPLKPGDILCYDGHIDLVGEEHEGGFVKYNGGHYTEAGSVEFQGSSCIQHIDGWPNDSRIKFALRLNWGNSNAKGEPYVGYQGNEMVVSPVTGILLEYGTYDKEKDIDNQTGDPYRVNTDLKYGNSIVLSSKAGEEPDPNNNEKPQSDEVGYAKILVLDAENYKRLEAVTGNRWKNKGTSLVNVAVSSTGGDDETIKSYFSDYDGNDLILKEEKQLGDNNLDGDKSDKWPEIDKLVYGYKEFAEEYEYAGISGYTIFIDGFVCERPDEEFSNGENLKENLKTKIPNDGKHDSDDVKLQMSTYQNITESIVSNEDNADKLLPSLYEPHEQYKMASEKATKKLNAEIAVKNQAPSSICISSGGEKLVFIKEGTILGRTMTDRELIMEVRGQDESVLKEFRPTVYNEDDDEKEDKVMGNYLRMLMRDTDGTDVENIEDYIKLDEGGSGQSGDQEYQFQEGDLDLLADAIHHEGCGAYDDPQGSKEDQLYLSTSVGFTMINKLNSDSGYNHAAGWGWSNGKSQLYELLCVVPCAACGGNGWYAISDKGTMGGLKNRADANSYEYCDLCMEAAEYIKENDSLNFKNNGKYDSQYASGEGMPHTCWEQGAGYYGNHKIWAHFRNDYLFDTVD